MDVEGPSDKGGMPGTRSKKVRDTDREEESVEAIIVRVSEAWGRKLKRVMLWCGIVSE